MGLDGQAASLVAPPLFPLKRRGRRAYPFAVRRRSAMEVDRRAFIASLGGTAAVCLMDHEAKAEALEHYMEEQLDRAVEAGQGQPEKFPTVAEIEGEIETRPFRRGGGTLFTAGRGNVAKLEPMPARPTLH